MSRAAIKLLEAAERYGDDRVQYESLVHAWKRGDPPIDGFNRDAEYALLSAARKYATSTRAKRKATGA